MGKDQELLAASRKGDLESVQKLLTVRSKLAVSFRIKVSANVNCQDLSGYTSLHHAALNGHCEIVELLLENSASAKVCDNKGCFPLHLAAWSGYSSIAQVLLTHGPSVAAVNEKNGDNETALHCASQHGHTTTVKVLLQNGADPSVRNIRDESALDLACQYGRLTVVTMLLQSCPTLLQRSPDCFSPLHLASRNGHKEVVELLLAHGADINGVGENGTALHEAALFGKLEVVKLLLERGANPHSLDPQNRTALELVKQMDTNMTRNISQLILARLQDGDDYEFVETPKISANLDSPHTYMDMAKAFLERSMTSHKNAVTVNVQPKWNEVENTSNKMNSSNTSTPQTSLHRSRKGGFSLRRSSSARSTKSLPRLPSSRSLSSGLDLSSTEQFRQRHPSTNMFPALPFSLPTTPLLSFSTKQLPKGEEIHPVPRKRRLSLRAPHTQSMFQSSTTTKELEFMLRKNKPHDEKPPFKYKEKIKPSENVPLKVVVKTPELPDQKTPLKPDQKAALKMGPKTIKTPEEPKIIQTQVKLVEKTPKQPVEITPLKIPSPGVSNKPKKPVRSKFSVSSILTPSPPPIPPKPFKRTTSSQGQSSNHNTAALTTSSSDAFEEENNQVEEAVYANYESYDPDVPPSPFTAMALISNTLQKAISQENLFEDNNSVFENPNHEFTDNPSVVISNEDNVVLYDNINLPFADDIEQEKLGENIETASPSDQKPAKPISKPSVPKQPTKTPKILPNYSNISIVSQEVDISEENSEKSTILLNDDFKKVTIEDDEISESATKNNNMQSENFYENMTKYQESNKDANDAVFFNENSKLDDKVTENDFTETEIIQSPISFVEVKNARILSTKSSDTNQSSPQFVQQKLSTSSSTQQNNEDSHSIKDELHLPPRINSELDGSIEDWDDQLSDRTEDFEIPREVRKFRGLMRGASFKGQQPNYKNNSSPYTSASLLKSTPQMENTLGESPGSSVVLTDDENKMTEPLAADICDTNNNNSISSGKESSISSSDEIAIPDFNTIYNTVSEVRSQSQSNSEAGDEWKQIANIMASISVDESTKGSVYAKEFEETFWKIMTGSELPRQMSTWLSDLGLSQYETVLVGNGFDNVDFLANDILEEQDLLDMGIPEFSHRRQLIESSKNLSQLKPLSQMDHSSLPLTITEWLISLDLPVNYSDLFNISDGDFIGQLYNLHENEIKSMIPKRGHFKRIMTSLRPNMDQFNSSYQLKSTWKSTENIKQPKKSEKIRSRINSAPGHQITPDITLKKNSKLNENHQFPVYLEIETSEKEMAEPTSNNIKQNLILRPPNETNTEVTVSSWRHSSETLINGNCNYQAYYLGSMLIQELKGIESTREACTKMKKSTGAMKKIPTITLAINYKGVKFIDFKSKHEIAEHEIRNISFTSQDTHDLSTFAYITHDTRTGHHYCHVFRVTTLDMAYEIILTLGQAFEVAYQMILNEKSASHPNEKS